MSILSVSDLPLKGKKVIVRIDCNVPFGSAGEISDLTRIKACLPTIFYILRMGGAVILCGHLGSPKGKKNTQYTLEPCAKALAKLLNNPVLFLHDCVGTEVQKAVSAMKPGEIILIENLRFYPAEEHPELDPSFAETLASYGDVYVDDAFGSAHRKHSSTFEVPLRFKGKAAAGFLMLKEIEALGTLVHSPPTPFHVIVGGAKISSKIGPLEALLDKAETLYIGGAMAFTFLFALGYEIGDSPYEPTHLELAKKILGRCKRADIPVFLPVDSVVSNKTEHKIVTYKDGIKKGWEGVDIGPKTLAIWEKELVKANSIFWNGPVGIFENPLFAEGTFRLAKFLSKLSSLRVIGGGDSVAAINKLGLSERFSHISTGGGASLELLEKGSLPGIDALSKK